MQVDARWAQPVIADSVSASVDGYENKHNIEQRQSSAKSLPPSTIQPQLITTNSFFPPQRVEPIDMARSQQTTSQNRTKVGYTQPPTTDEPQQTTTYYKQNRPIKRVKHPADRSSIITFFQYMSNVFCVIFVSFPCIILLTLLVPICWFVRGVIRLICRHSCPVTPCNCAYLSASDLFWFYNSNLSTNRTKIDVETNKYDFQTVPPIAASVFFLDGKFKNRKFFKNLIYI